MSKGFRFGLSAGGWAFLSTIWVLLFLLGLSFLFIHQHHSDTSVAYGYFYLGIVAWLYVYVPFWLVLIVFMEERAWFANVYIVFAFLTGVILTFVSDSGMTASSAIFLLVFLSLFGVAMGYGLYRHVHAAKQALCKQDMARFSLTIGITIVLVYGPAIWAYSRLLA